MNPGGFQRSSGPAAAQKKAGGLADLAGLVDHPLPREGGGIGGGGPKAWKGLAAGSRFAAGLDISNPGVGLGCPLCLEKAPAHLPALPCGLRLLKTCCWPSSGGTRPGVHCIKLNRNTVQQKNQKGSK